jgi:hypothetical protein
MDILRQHSEKPMLSWIGGASRDRTDDLKLAKLPLSQLSYGPDPKDGLNTYQERCSSARSGVTTDFSREKEWWAWEDLNFRPHAYQARALTN